MKEKKYIFLIFFIFMLIIPSFLIFDLFPYKNAIRNVDRIGSKAVIWTDASGDVTDLFTGMPAVHDPVDITTVDENASLDMLNVTFVGTPASGSNPGWMYMYQLLFDKDHDNATSEYVLMFQMAVGGLPTVNIQRGSDGYYWNGTDWVMGPYSDTQYAYVSGSNNFVFNFSSCPDLIGDNWYNIAALYTDMATVYYADVAIGTLFTLMFFAGGSTGADIWAPNIQDTRCVPSVASSGANFTIKANVTDDTNVSTVIASIQRPDESLIQNVTLFDDGAHNDGAFNDSVYANTWNSTGQAIGTYFIDYWANDTLGYAGEEENARIFMIDVVNETGIYDGFYINWTGALNIGPVMPWSGSENYEFIEGNMYYNHHVDSLYGPDEWITDNATRLLRTNQFFWGDNVHDHMFIPKNTSLNDNILICVFGTDSLFTVSGIKYLDVLDATLKCWNLTDASGSELFYETSTGLLVSGTFSMGVGMNYTIEAESTNAPLKKLPGFSIESPQNETYYQSDIPIIIGNLTNVDTAWYRNSTDGIIWSSNYTLVYNGTHFTNSSALNWSDGSNGVQIFANDSSSELVGKEQWFTIDTTGPWIELDSPENLTYLYRTFPVMVSNYTAIDNITFRYDSGGGWTNNMTFTWNGTHYVNDTILWADGNYHLQVFANDSSTEVALREEWFIVEATYPLNISRNTGQNGEPEIVMPSPGNFFIFWTYPMDLSSDPEIFYDHNLNGHFGNQADLSQDPSNYDLYSSTTTDSSGNVHVAWTKLSLLMMTYETVYTNNSGGTFGPPMNLPDSPLYYNFLPTIVVDSLDIVHVVWLAVDATATIWEIYYSNNTGGTFNPAQLIPSDVTNTFTYFSLAIDDSDTIHFACVEDFNGNLEVMYRNITDGIVSNPVNVSNRIGADTGPSLAVNSTGMVHIAWRAYDTTTGNSDIFYSNNEVGTFSSPLNVTQNSSINDIAPCIALDDTQDRPDIVFISWVFNSSPVSATSNMKLAMINNTRGSFGEIEDITPFQTLVNESNLAIDPVNQELHIVWMGSPRFTGSPTPANIYYTYTNYSYPLYVGIVSPQNQTYNRSDIPVIAYNASKSADMMWFRNDSGTGWSSNSTLLYAGNSYVNQSNLNWADGHYHIQVFANDTNGVESMDEIFFTVDTQAPLISATYPMNGTFVTNVTTWINGTVDSTGTTIRSLTLNSSDFILIEDPTGTSAGSFGFRNQTNILGNYSLEITVTDEAGWVNSTVVYFAVDNLAPQLTLTEPAGNVVSGYVWFNGTADGTGSELTLYHNDSRISVVLNPNGTVSGPFALVNNTNIPVGSFTLNLTIVDQAGFKTELIRSIYIDNELPTLNITIPTNGSTIITSLISINGTCNSTGSLILNITSNDSRFQIDVNPIGLPEGLFSFINSTNLNGRYAVKINVTDLTGNSTEEVIWFYVDSEDPTGSITNPLVDGTVISTIDVIINGTANGTVSPIQSVEINMTEFTIDIDPTGLQFGSFSFVNNTAILEGKYVIEINITDDANRSRLITRMFYVDTTMPSLSISTPATNGTVIPDLTIWINGTANATGSLITFLLNDTVNFGIQTDPTGLSAGNFSIWNVTRLNGRYALNITVVDGTGNATEQIVWFYVDYQDPTGSITNPAIDWTTISTTDIIINGTANGTGSPIQSVEINMTEFTLDIDPTGLMLGNFSFVNNTALLEGLYVIEVNITDGANRSQIIVRSFYVDFTSPTLDITSVETTGSIIWINGTVNSTGSLITNLILNDTVNFAIQTDPTGLEFGNFAVWNITNLNGAYALNITVVDGAGFATENVTLYYVDNEDPSGTIILPPLDGTILPGPFCMIVGTANGTFSPIQSVQSNMSEFVILLDPSGSLTGTFSFWNVSNIPEGKHVIEINITDSVNRSGLITRMFYIDGTLPTLSITTPTSNGTIIPDSTIWINGTTNATGSTITFLINDTVNFGVQTDPTGLMVGNFSIWNITRLNGRYALNITVIDLAGFTREQIVWFYVDYEDPTASIINPVVDGTTVSTVDIFINGTANGTVTAIQSVEINMTEFSIDIDPAGSPFGSFSFVNNTPILEGRYVIEINVTDDANRSRLITRMFYIDTSMPTLSISTPASNGIVIPDLTIWINGTANATGSLLTFMINDTVNFGIQTDPTGLSAGNFSIWNVTRLNGRYALNITVVDGTGNATEQIVWFYVDYEDPTGSITNPVVDGTVVSAIDIFINGTANGTATPIQSVEINMTEFTIDINPAGSLSGNFSFVNNTALLEGRYAIEINITDDANRSIIIIRMFYLDRTPPIVNVTSPAINGTSVSGSTIWINGTVNATGSVIVNFVINDTINFGIQSDPTGLDQGNFSIWNITNLQETTYAVMINVTDSAGFEDYITIFFTVDNIPVGDPAIQLTVPGYDSDAIGGLFLNISGIAFGNSSLIAFIWMNDTNWSLSVDPSGSQSGPFVFSNNTFIPDGLYIINITVNNTDGLSASIVRSFYVDNTQPPAPPNLTRSIVGNTVTLIWQPAPDLTNVTYLIYRNSVNIANTTLTNFTDPNLSPGTYVYQIYAIDNAGNIGTAATETVTISGGGFDPRLILLIIIIGLIIAAVVAIASFLIIRARRRRPAAAKKPVSKKPKIQMFEVPASEKLKDIRLELRLKDLGFKVIHDTKEPQNRFNLNTKEIIVKDMDNFVIARLRILAELTSDPVIITARMKALNEMNQFCQITASDFSALFKPQSLNIFIDTFQDNAVNTWLLQNTKYNTDIYQNNLSQKILEYQKIQKEMYLTGDQSKTRRFFNNLALGTLLALYSQNFGSDLLISSIISDPGLLRNIHDDFLNFFTQVKDKIPSAADYESFVTFFKGLIHKLWK